VGYLAGWSQAGLGTQGAVIGALVATYFTFLPSFAWILLFAPSIERMRGEPQIAGALSAVSAAVVGVVASLGVWLFQESIVDPWSGALGAAAFVAMRFGGWSVPVIVLATAAAALVRFLAGPQS
jgi:chromate transporter